MGRGQRNTTGMASAAAPRPAAPVRRAPVPTRVARVLEGLDLRNEGLFYGTERRSACTGHCDDYCRCTVIEGIDPPRFQIAEIAAFYEVEDEVSRYALERALSALIPFGEESSFEFKTVGGYYGQELDGIWFEPALARRLDRQASALLALPDPDSQVRESLLAEYGRLLPELEAAAFMVQTVPRDMLRAGAESHLAGLTAASLSPYRSHRDIIGLALASEGGRLRLIDGYHRFAATDHDPVDVLVAYPDETRARPIPPPRPRSLAEAFRRERGTNA